MVFRRRCDRRSALSPDHDSREPTGVMPDGILSKDNGPGRRETRQRAVRSRPTVPFCGGTKTANAGMTRDYRDEAGQSEASNFSRTGRADLSRIIPKNLLLPNRRQHQFFGGLRRLGIHRAVQCYRSDNAHYLLQHGPGFSGSTTPERAKLIIRSHVTEVSKTI